MDVYVIECTSHGEKVERVKSCHPPERAMVLYFSYYGVEPYELVAFSSVVVLPTAHVLIQHVNKMHEEYVESLSNERRAAAQRKGERQRLHVGELIELKSRCVRSRQDQNILAEHVGETSDFCPDHYTVKQV